MSQSNISIDTQQIKQLGETIISQNNTLNQTLLDIEKCMDAISAAWISPAGTEANEAFAKIKPDFENSTKLINKYAQFLRLAAEAYEEAEKRIKQGASSFEG